MAYRDEIIQKLKNQYPCLYSQFGVKRIGLFGSILGLEFITLIEHLEGILKRKVDVITKDGLKNIRVKKVSSSIERSIIYV